jgi:hypothetical protein
MNEFTQFDILEPGCILGIIRSPMVSMRRCHLRNCQRMRMGMLNCASRTSLNSKPSWWILIEVPSATFGLRSSLVSFPNELASYLDEFACDGQEVTTFENVLKLMFQSFLSRSYGSSRLAFVEILRIDVCMFNVSFPAGCWSLF